MHKDLSEDRRVTFELSGDALATWAHENGQSLALAREAMINGFDKAAAELDAGEVEGD